MTAKHLIFTVVVVLALAACVCSVSAIQLTVGSMTLPNVGTTGVVMLTLDPPVPNGLSGYSVTFTIADETIAEIVGVNYLVWTDPVPDEPAFRSGSIVPKSATIKVADVNRAIGTSATAIDLGSVTVKGLLAGSTDITVTVNQMDDDNGNAVPLAGATGKISVQQAPGSITVTSTPVAGADIFIDGSTTSAGTTNTTISNIAVGVHSIKVSRTGYVDAVQDVTVASGQTVAVNFPLKKPVTIIVKTLNAPPLYADIYINGVLKGTTDATFTGMPPGTYTVQVTKIGYYSKSTTRTLSPGVSSTFSFTLSPATNEVGVPDESPYGSIIVDSTPPEAWIYIDGKNTTLTTHAEIEIYPGVYDVTVKLDRHLTPPAQKETVIKHQPTSVSFTLFPVQSNPEPIVTCLWPPNNKFVDMTLSPIKDSNGNTMMLTITKITSDEPTVTAGGAKDTPDATFKKGPASQPAFQVRAERAGAGNGRVYMITFTADNGKPGGVTTGTVNVCVAHDQSNKGDTCACNDDGQKYDATATK